MFELLIAIYQRKHPKVNLYMTLLIYEDFRLRSSLPVRCLSAPACAACTADKCGHAQAGTQTGHAKK